MVANKLVLLTSALVILTLPASAIAKRQRDDDARIVGKCFTIHGRLKCYNGTPCFRIWKIGTHRQFGVLDDDNENPKFPENIARAHPTFGTEIYGDFLVCPLTTSRPGFMQMVMIKSVKHLVVKRYTDP